MTIREANEQLYGICYCNRCHPEAFPIRLSRQNEGHIAIRFGDHLGGMKYQIWVDGVDRSNQVIEALPGANGWVWMIARDTNGKAHLCPCEYGGECEFVVTGNVEVRGQLLAGRTG